MARIKIAYVGGGSTRGAGTMASFIHQGENFLGSEIALVDLDPERLALVKQIADRMIAARGLDLSVTATTDRRAGLADADAVLTSYRPGGFEARVLDEKIPLTYDVIGQETHGPGGFFMALRSVHALQPILDDMAAVCPDATIFNYTNPVNLVSQAVEDHSDASIVSLCEGPIIFPAMLAWSVGLDPAKLEIESVGLNHASWSVKHRYDGGDLIELLRDRLARAEEFQLTPYVRRMLETAVRMESVPSGYFQHYYYEADVLAEMQAKPTVRSEDILAAVPGYWEHYRDEATHDDPQLDPKRSRGGIHELELAIDCMDTMYNDKGEEMPVNVSNRGSVPGLRDDLVVETRAVVDARGIHRVTMPALPAAVAPLVEQLGEFQMLASHAAWTGSVTDGVDALFAHPWVRTRAVAEAMYAEMARAHRAYLPDRLVPA
jgi:6-phospho-beta-glucosidase